MISKAPYVKFPLPSQNLNMSFVTRLFLGQYYFESHPLTGHYKKAHSVSDA